MASEVTNHDRITLDDNVQRRFDWSSVMLSGLMSGGVMLMVWMALNQLIYQRSPWQVPEYIGAMVLGRGELAPGYTHGADIAEYNGLGFGLDNIDLATLLAGLGVHFSLSVIFAMSLDVIVRKASLTSSLAIGAAFGVVLYLVNFYVIAPNLFPWMNDLRDFSTIIAHLAFGASAGAFYDLVANKRFGLDVDADRAPVRRRAYANARS